MLCKEYATAELIYGYPRGQGLLWAVSTGELRLKAAALLLLGGYVCWLSRQSGGCWVSSITAAPARRE